MDNSVIAKSGWLLKKGSNSSEWHKNWVELYRDGFLKYYETDHSPNAEDVIFMPRECILVKTGTQVEGVKPPENHSHQCLFSVSSVGNKTWYFCGQSLDEMRVWQLALEQSRLILSPRHHLRESSHSYISPQSLYSSYINTQSSAFIPSLTNGSQSSQVRPMVSSSCETLSSHLSPYMTSRVNTSLYPYYNLQNYQTNRSFLPLSHPYHQRGLTNISPLTGASFGGLMWSQPQTRFWW